MGIFYRVANLTMRTLLILLTRWRVEGRENVPKRGPLIIVSNHLSVIDPPLLGASVPRRVTFMAKQELFHSLFSRTVVGAYGAFPVRRGQLDRAAVRMALDALHHGLALGMFPEGSRSRNGQLQVAQLGVSLIASRSCALILPVGISGSEGVKGVRSFLRRPRIMVKIGHPFSLPADGYKPTRTRLADHTDLIMDRVAELLPDSYRGSSWRWADSRGVDAS
jgi:1-acyl-sn-glycerol-3-phosphate acyltransferase